MRVLRLEVPRERVRCQLPSDQLHPNTELWKGYRERRAKINGGDPKTCMSFASWDVDGVLLCTRHAGIKALEQLEEK